MWRFLCLALLAEVSFAEFKITDKLKTDTEGKLISEAVFPVKFDKKPIVKEDRYLFRDPDEFDDVFPVKFDKKPIVKEDRYLFRDPDEFDDESSVSTEEVRKRSQWHPRPNQSKMVGRIPTVNEELSHELKEWVREKLISLKLEKLIETADTDKRRKVCILAVRRTIYHVAKYKKTGEIPELALKNREEVKKLIKKVMDLPVKFDIREEEKDIKEVEMEMDLPMTSLTPKLRQMKRELVRDCGDKYPVFA